MTQEEKELLLKDLSARLGYGVKVAFQVGNNMPDIRVFTGEDYDYLKSYHFIDEFTNCTFKPYLRPMSSMTEEEIDTMWDISENNAVAEGSSKITDLLNKWSLDHHHLIEKGLAIEVTKENNPYGNL